MPKQNSLVEQALLILNKGGQGSSAAEMLALSYALQNQQNYGYARRILNLARKDLFVQNNLGLELDQQCALNTFKDVDLPHTARLRQALHILKEGRPELDNSKNQQTLGIAGSIYKKKWEADGQKQHLEMSMGYYLKGYVQGAVEDNGYTGINAAFVIDLLAKQQRPDAISSPVQPLDAAELTKHATLIRTDLLKLLTAKEKQAGFQPDWWFYVTIAEAHFGLGNFEAARPWLIKARELDGTPEWKLEITTRQLAQIAMLRMNASADVENSSAWSALSILIEDVEDQVAALQTAFSGKVGLALSGGGFRASLYHIGVLAKMAEMDMLRNVEVMSCVSGGSIIGAHYYLEVRHLLQTKKDRDILRQDYIDIVQKISKEFLAGVQRNIRTRVVSNLYYNLKMMFTHYSRTERAGELYEKELFGRVIDGDENNDRWLNHLFVHPLDKDGVPDNEFNPKRDNWRRKAKVPILILNATTLNTGHNWQFTASWMGESPSSVQKVDGNYRLRRMYYKEDGDEKFQRRIRLGHAVAASACVPGMFEPLSLRHLFDEKVIRLVDGGVHDNQGIIGLLEQDCTVLLVSDASGQMGTIDDPSSGSLAVPLRANDILMERVRNSQFDDLDNRYHAGLLKGLMFIHLKMGLDVQAVDWINCEDPSDQDPQYNPQARLTAYNIRKDVQKKLAAIRTDLDSFHDTEAHALMCSGYLMTEASFSQTVKGFPVSHEEAPTWSFMEIADDLQRADSPASMHDLLRVGSERMFKIWRLSQSLQALAVLLAIAFTGIAVWMIVLWSATSLLTVGEVGWSLAFLVLGLVVSKTIIRVIRYRETMIRFATGLGLVFFGWFAANLHLYIFDRLYLSKGRRERFEESVVAEEIPVAEASFGSQNELLPESNPEPSIEPRPEPKVLLISEVAVNGNDPELLIEPLAGTALTKEPVEEKLLIANKPIPSRH